MGGIPWRTDEAYAEKYGKERRTATVELAGLEARVLHTAEEEYPDGTAHHIIAYVKVEGVEMGRKDGWNFGEDGLDERTLQIAGEAVGKAREKLGRIRQAALVILAGKNGWGRTQAGGDHAPAAGSEDPRAFEVFHYEDESGEGVRRPVRDANVSSKGEAVACASGLQDEHDLIYRVRRSKGEDPDRRCYYVRNTATGSCFFADGRMAPLRQGAIGPTGLGWDPDPCLPGRASEALLWAGGMRAAVSHHPVDHEELGRVHFLVARAEIEGVEVGGDCVRHDGDEGLDEAARGVAGRIAGEARDKLQALVAVAEAVLEDTAGTSEEA